jgi:hypothetical protein
MLDSSQRSSSSLEMQTLGGLQVGYLVHLITHAHTHINRLDHQTKRRMCTMVINPVEKLH